MDFLATIDPELLAAPDPFLPAELVTAAGDDPPLARQMVDELMAMMAQMRPPSDVTAEERTIPGPEGDIPIVIYQPQKKRPARECCGYTEEDTSPALRVTI